MKKRTVAVVMAAAMTIGMMVTGVSVQAGVEDKTLIVGFDAEYPPFGYKDDNGEYVGFDLDLAQEVCDNLGWELVKKPINWDTKDMELKSLKKKYKSKGFAAGCSREVIERGAEQLGWELEKLLTMTLSAMAATEDRIQEEMDALNA